MLYRLLTWLFPERPPTPEELARRAAWDAYAERQQEMWRRMTPIEREECIRRGDRVKDQLNTQAKAKFLDDILGGHY